MSIIFFCALKQTRHQKKEQSNLDIWFYDSKLQV